jgi:hypothetical protein
MVQNFRWDRLDLEPSYYRYGYLVIRAVENTVNAPATTLEIQLSPKS